MPLVQLRNIGKQSFHAGVQMKTILTLVDDLRENLRNLPPHSPEWESDISDFVAWLIELMSEKEAERAASRNLRDALLDARERFSCDLRYLGLDMSRWHERGLSSYESADVSRVLEIVEDFKAALSDYRSHPKERGATREETRRLMEEEDEYADRAAALHRQLDNLLAPPADDGPPPKADPPDDSLADSDAAGRPVPQASPDDSRISPAPPQTDMDAAHQQDAAGDAEPSDEEIRTEDGGESESQDSGEAETRHDEADLAAAESVEESARPSVDESDAVESGDTEENGEETDDAEESPPETSAPDLAGAMWEMVGQDDLAGAYWIAKSMKFQGSAPPVPTHLLKAAQGARWLSPNSNAYVNDLFEIANSHEVPNENDVQILMGLAAALQASAVKDGAYLQAWLNAPQSCPRIDAIASPPEMTAPSVPHARGFWNSERRDFRV